MAVSTIIELVDRMTSPLMAMANAANAVAGRFDGLQGAAEIDSSAISAMSRQIDIANAAAMLLADTMGGIQGAVPQAPAMPQPPAAPAWQTPQNPEVFAGNDAARYAKEIQAANAMLGQMYQTQMQIGQQAANMEIMPPEAVVDIASMSARIQTLQSQFVQMQGGRVQMAGVSQANSEMDGLRQQMSKALSIQQTLNSAMGKMDVAEANAAYNSLNAIVSATEQSIRDSTIAQEQLNAAARATGGGIRGSTAAQGQLNQQMHAGQGAADRLLGKIGKMVAAYASFQGVKSVINIADNFSQASARLDMLASGSETVASLQNRIFQAAQNSRGEYLAMTQTVSKLGLLAGDAFASNDEIIKFTEQMNKQFTIGGASIEEQTSAMYQLTQAMAAGKLQGDEYRSITENAPMLAGAIESYMSEAGVDGTMKDWAKDGMLTAEVIKAALFSVADETDERFSGMPKTFGQIAIDIKNQVLMQFQPILERLSAIANSGGFKTFVDNAVSALAVLGNAASIALDLIIGGVNMLGPPLALVGGWFAGIYETVSANWAGIAPAVAGVAAAALGVAAAVGVWSAATSIQAAVQWVANSALLACPLTWIIVAIVGIIGAIYAVVGAINHFQGTAISATGAVFGVFAVLGAHILNSTVVPLWNSFAALGNFIGNVFSSPVDAVEILFYDLAVNVLKQVANMAHGIEGLLNKIPGVAVDLSSGLDSWRADMEAASAKVKDRSGWIEYFGTMEYMDYGGAASAGYAAGQKFEDAISAFDPSSLLTLPALPAGAGAAGGGPTNVEDLLSNIDKNTSDQLGYSDEELELWRDIAGREAINRYTTSEIKVDMTGMSNRIDGSLDVDGIISRLADGVMEALLVSAEAVHT